MNRRTNLMALAVGLLALIGLVCTASAAVKKKTVTPTTVVYCPKVKMVCNPCSNVANPPSSSVPAQDTCCALVTIGWEVCSTSQP